MLRNRNASQADNVANQNLKSGHPVKRQICDGVDPNPKRAALNDLTSAVSNFRIDSKKPSLLKEPTKIVKRVIATSKSRTIPKPESVDPCPGFDFDKQNAGELSSVSVYAVNIFNYYKQREAKFKIADHSRRHPNLTKEMRADVIDWIIELQQTCALNHETLYLAIKLLDSFLHRTKDSLKREHLFLAALSAVLIAAKYDELPDRVPLIDDLLYVAEDKFKRADVLAMERKMFKTVGFDIGMPLSYRFLRRFARAAQVSMETLTLARYFLETSLLFVEFVGVSESLMAAAAFLLALRMEKAGDWTPAMQKYSGYKTEHIEPLMWCLNHMMHARPTVYPRFQTVFVKYSDKNFFNVASIPFLTGGKAASDPVGPPSPPTAAAAALRK